MYYTYIIHGLYYALYIDYSWIKLCIMYRLFMEYFMYYT